MDLPLVTVTETQAPHLAALSQLESESAEPKIPAGSVYVENEQVPVGRLGA